MVRVEQMQRSQLYQVVDALREGLGGRLVAVVLYGSRARGEAEVTSDWDLLIIARDLPDRTFRRYRFLKGIVPPEWRGWVSFLAKTPEEFEASTSSLLLDIALDADVLYDTDDYAATKLETIRQLIREHGLRRERVGEKEFAWRWKEAPNLNWSLEWEMAE